MNILLAADDTMFWRVLTDLVLFACVVLMLGCALAFVGAVLQGDHDDDNDDDDTEHRPPAPRVLDTRARLDAAVRLGSGSGPHVSGVRDVPDRIVGLVSPRPHSFSQPSVKGFRRFK